MDRIRLIRKTEMVLDTIYAINENNKYLTKNIIQTDFKPKRRPGRDKNHK